MRMYTLICSQCKELFDTAMLGKYLDFAKHKPVYCHKCTKENSIKGCGNCKYQFKSVFQAPCMSCKDHSNFRKAVQNDT